jgi:pentatricopeptide repeat protein
MKIVLANALMEMYSRCGGIQDVLMVFETMGARDVVTWNTLMAGCGRTGETDLGLSMLERMGEEGLEPGSITFVNVLTLCSHAGLVDSGLRCFQAMIDAYGIAPELSHYNCIVDLLGRSGRLNDLFQVVESRLFEPDIVTWSSTLSACHQWGDAELGNRALRCIGLESNRRNQTSPALASRPRSTLLLTGGSRITQGVDEIDPSDEAGEEFERSSIPSMHDFKHRARYRAMMQLRALKGRGSARGASDCFHFWGD